MGCRLEKEYGGQHEPYPALSDKIIAEFGPNPRDIAEAEAAGITVETVNVGARCVECFNVPILEAGEVQWSFKGDLDVGFKCIFMPKAEDATDSGDAPPLHMQGVAAAAATAAAAGSESATSTAARSDLVIAVPSRRAVSGAGSFTVAKAGTVVVELDNSFSLFTGKTVKFSVTL